MQCILLGIDGVNGEDPPIPDDSTLAISVFESTQFSYNVSMNETIAVENTTITITTMNIRVFGKPATKPGNGGHGGVGGMGGYAGNHFIVGIEDFAVFADPGNSNFWIGCHSRDIHHTVHNFKSKIKRQVQ